MGDAHTEASQGMWVEHPLADTAVYGTLSTVRT